MSDEVQAVDFEVPVTLRNWNFAKSAVLYTIAAVVFFWLNEVSSWRLEWLGVGLLAFAVLGATFFAVSYLVASLRVEFDFFRIGGVFIRRRFTWDEVQSFSILPPERRTPFMLNFWPWRDQARVVLASGKSCRIRAIEPRHGFSVVTLYRLLSQTSADQTVDWLNRFHETRLAFSAVSAHAPLE